MQCYIDIDEKQINEVANKVNFALRKVLQLTSDEATWRVRMAYKNLDKSAFKFKPLSAVTTALKENKSKNSPPLAWLSNFVTAKMPERETQPFMRGASSYTTYIGLPEKISVYRTLGTSSWKGRKASYLSKNFANNLLGIKSYRYFRKNVVGNYVNIEDWGKKKDRDIKKRYYVLVDKEKKQFDSYSYSQDTIDLELPTERFISGSKINITERMRRFLAFRGFYLKKNTTYFDIPPRDFMGQVQSKIDVRGIVQWCLNKNFGGLVLYNDHFEYPGVTYSYEWLAKTGKNPRFMQSIVRKFSYHLDDPEYKRSDQVRMRALSKHYAGSYFGVVLQPGETDTKVWKEKNFDVHWKDKIIHKEIDSGFLKNSVLDISINI